MTKILLVDDHPLIRTALALLVKDMMPDCTIDEATDSDSALEKVRSTVYSLAIMDVSMPNTDSLALLQNVLACQPATKILMFSMNPEETYARRYLQMGAMGYLRKDAPEGEIKNAIRTVLNNNRYISRSLAEKLAIASFQDEPANPFDKLSAREFEVMRHFVKGESIAGICKILHVNSSTVSSHKARIFEKLGVASVVDLIVLAKNYHIM